MGIVPFVSESSLILYDPITFAALHWLLTLRKWVIQGAEFETVAAETIHGLMYSSNKHHKRQVVLY